MRIQSKDFTFDARTRAAIDRDRALWFAAMDGLPDHLRMPLNMEQMWRIPEVDAFAERVTLEVRKGTEKSKDLHTDLTKDGVRVWWWA